MSEKGIINNALHRPLDGSSFFDKYIPKSTCTSTYLGKGDTFFSMDGIKANILKNYDQCAKLAPQLQKRSLPQTCTAIYDFLYNHIQYKADGADQNLRGPACSWHVRQDGIDCKSYSIFAGCLLSSLGIKYYIRKIKQPAMLPSEYTHVYIIVPKDQNTGSLNGGYYVIDATKHTNTEAAFIAKNDVYMEKLKHFGLQAPASKGAVTMPNLIKGDRGPISITAVEGFNNFTEFLQQVGIDADIICQMKKYVKKFTDNGIDPYFKFIPGGVVIEDKRFTYIIPNRKAKIYRSPLAIAREASKEYPNKGLNGIDWGWIRDGVSGSGNSDTTTEGQLGEELGGVVTGMISDSNFWDNTFGAIFGNGWDLSCWGASNSPKKAAQEIQVDAPSYFKSSGLSDAGQGGLNTANLQKFVDVAEVYKANRNFGKSNQDLAKCTRKGNEVGYEGMNTALFKVLEAAENLLKSNGGQLIRGNAKTISTYNYNVPSGYLDGKLITDSRFSVTASTYTVIAPTPIVLPPDTTGGPVSTGGGSTTPIGNTGGGSSNTGGGSTSGGNTGGGSTTADPTAGLSNDEKAIYASFVSTGGALNAYYLYLAQHPGYVASQKLRSLLHNPKTRSTGQVNTNPVKKKAGINPILGFALIGGGIYMAMKNKKKNTKKLN